MALRHYEVTWKIDVGAESPRQAAEIALEQQREPASETGNFTVEAGTGPRFRVDLDDEDDVGGRVVYSPNRTLTGFATAATKTCILDGCGGRRFLVVWEGGARTWPCIKGVAHEPDGSLKLC